MAMPVALALTQELDVYTPCIVINGDTLQQKIFIRMLSVIKVILETSLNHFSFRQQQKIIEALRFSAKHHAGVRRKDEVTPYFMHLIEVAFLIIDMKVYDFKILVSAILHDVVEDTKVTLKEIAKRFGAAIRNIVDLMTKHPNFVRKSRYFALMKEEPDLNCRWRVIFLKFVDRIHNMMTLSALSKESKDAKIRETQREFPSLYHVLVKTILKLLKKGTLKNNYYKNLPFRLNNRLFYEMSRYT